MTNDDFIKLAEIAGYEHLIHRNSFRKHHDTVRATWIEVYFEKWSPHTNLNQLREVWNGLDKPDQVKVSEFIEEEVAYDVGFSCDSDFCFNRSEKVCKMILEAVNES